MADTKESILHDVFNQTLSEVTKESVATADTSENITSITDIEDVKKDNAVD